LCDHRLSPNSKSRLHSRVFSITVGNKASTDERDIPEITPSSFPRETTTLLNTVRRFEWIVQDPGEFRPAGNTEVTYADPVAAC
jgi:hypothetical protein